MTRDAQNAALAGIRIVDLTTIVFGPSATQALADYGADVIKVEAPEGDSTRHTGPTREKGMASLFLGSNRNKRSVVLDLKTEAGREALLALIDSADIFIHNIRPQKLEALGASRAQLCERNPRLIYLSLLGFGEDGPYAGRPAYDDVIQSLGGAADLGRRQGGVPRFMPTIAADKVAGQMATHAALAALFQRERTGRGQYVEVPMFECFVQFLMIEHFYARHFVGEDGPAPPQEEEFGYRRTLAGWRKPFPTRDGFVCFMPYADRNWRDFFEAIGLQAWADNPKFASITERTKNIEELYRLLETLLAQKTTAHWLALGARLSIPCSRVNGMEDLEEDPHLAAVELFDVMEAGADWSMRFVRSPLRLSDSAVEPRLPPRLGEHTAEVLRELDLAPALVEQILNSQSLVDG